MAECSREAGADRGQLGRLGPGSEGASGVRGGWVPAGLTDLVVLDRGGESGVWEPARGSHEVSVHPSSGVAAAAQGCTAGVGSGFAFPTVFPELGQVFPWSGLFVLCSANENLQTS